MSTFICEHCGAIIIDSSIGYITGCKHYPLEKKIRAQWTETGEKCVDCGGPVEEIHNQHVYMKRCKTCWRVIKS